MNKPRSATNSYRTRFHEMELKLRNTLTRNDEVIRPDDERTFRFYCCGPTVYGPAHIGNLRTFVLQDVFRRLVEFLGIETCHVRNITDVDDKTIRESQKVGLPLAEFTEKWRAKFEEDCDALNVLPPSHTPSAVEHIKDQIDLIQILIEKGHAYEDGNGSVYFRINSFADYGKLSRLNHSGVRQNASARLNDNDEYGKESWQDFVLWKAWKPEDGPNRWDSPWGWGRPGWHIECSAMSMRYLGESFDLHSGGVDLIFPHHENEIAQSEAATCKPFVRHWFHVAHLRVNGEKMSKSLGNLFVLDEIIERGYTPEALRYLLFSGHYRQPLNFTWESLAAAESSLTRILGFTEGVDPGELAGGDCTSLETSLFRPVIDALCEDLNTPKALGALHTALQSFKGSDSADLESVRRDLARMLQLLGLPIKRPVAIAEVIIPSEVKRLAEQRQHARAARNWEEADLLRAALLEKGWEVRDTCGGFELNEAEVTVGNET
ncbi:MAG: cysteine--tRNA ligase [Verrucomicrobiota bacterium]